MAGSVETVTLLLENGADPNCQAKNGLAPMHLAAQEDQVAVAKVLVKHGCHVDVKTKVTAIWLMFFAKWKCIVIDCLCGTT